MSAAPLLNSQILGRAHYAARALLERELARTGNTFLHSIALNALAAQGGTAARRTIVERMASSVKTDEGEALQTLAELAGSGLVETVASAHAASPAEADRIQLTAEGRALQSRLAAFAAEVAPRVYGTVPEEDLAVAARVLLQITDRANAVHAEMADRS
jgi:DNA-binding MarR family transcriptional regulator